MTYCRNTLEVNLYDPTYLSKKIYLMIYEKKFGTFFSRIVLIEWPLFLVIMPSQKKKKSRGRWPALWNHNLEDKTI